MGSGPCPGRTRVQVRIHARAAGGGLLATVAAAAATLVMTATAASASGLGFYTLIGGSGATFQVLSSRDLVRTESDDSVFFLSTSGAGQNRLPFPVHAYDQTYQNVAVDSNGFVELGVTSAQVPFSLDVNDCLPTSTVGHPLVLAYWDDLIFQTANTSHGFPDGVFTKISGVAPHRRFVVSWQGEELATHHPVLARVVFQEGSQAISFVYGTSGGSSATIGIQFKQHLSSTQWTCDSGSDTAVAPGLRIAAVHHEGQQPV